MPQHAPVTHPEIPLNLCGRGTASAYFLHTLTKGLDAQPERISERTIHIKNHQFQHTCSGAFPKSLYHTLPPFCKLILRKHGSAELVGGELETTDAVVELAEGGAEGKSSGGRIALGALEGLGDDLLLEGIGELLKTGG